MSGQKPREIALQTLQRRSGGDFVEDLLERALARARLSPADRRLCQELVYGAVRWQATLDWLIALRTKGRAQKPLVQNLLRLGLYQLFWLERIPAYAAVHETVELAKQSGLGGQGGFVNALLRGYVREFEATTRLLADLKTSEPPLGYSHPAWLAARWQVRWGVSQAARLMEWDNTPPKTFARLNTLKTDAAKLLAQWREEGVEYDFVRHDWLEENLVFELKSHPPLGRLPSFERGWFYVQDPGTLLAVRELEPQPGEAVLDFCAAPGGKLSYIAQLLGNQGRLVAHDITPERLRLIQENCARLGVTCELGAPASCRRVSRAQAAGDAAAALGAPASRRRVSSTQAAGAVARAPTSESPLGLEPGPARHPRLQIRPAALRPADFDRVLVDAPCSNTGVMRRRVDLRWRIRAEEIERLRGLQLDLVRQAAPLLKPGGTLVYSTCSLEPEENLEVVEEFLRDQAQFKLDRDRELLPFVDGVDGAYVARLTRGG